MSKHPPLENYNPICLSGTPTSGVGYQTNYSNKPDPWPGNQALRPEAALRQAYIDRYTVPPGYPPGQFLPGDIVDGVVLTAPRPAPNIRIGYAAELFSVNGNMLKAMAMEGVFGTPTTTTEPTITEMSDASFIIPRRSQTAQHYWWESSIAGGTEETAIEVDNPNQPHGIYTETSPHGWPIYYYNTHEGTPPDPEPPDPEPEPIEEPPKPTYRVMETAILAPTWVKPEELARRGRLARERDYVEFINNWAPDTLNPDVLPARPSKKVLETASISYTWLPVWRIARRSRMREEGEFVWSTDRWLDERGVPPGV